MKHRASMECGEARDDEVRFCVLLKWNKTVASSMAIYEVF